MINRSLICIILAISMIGVVGAANYMYEKASVQGVGYKNVEKIISTQNGFNGSKLVEKESGSGNVITDRTELEAERQIGSNCGGPYLAEIIIWKDPGGPIIWPAEPVWPWDMGNYKGDFGPWGPVTYWDDFLPYHIKYRYRQWPTGFGPMDYINFTKQAEFEYMPVSYQTGTYDQKWMDKLCVQNYKIGAKFNHSSGTLNFGYEGLGEVFFWHGGPVEPAEELAYFPWSKTFSGVSNKEWMLSAPPVGKIGETFVFSANMKNWTPGVVQWTYMVEVH